MFPPAQAPVRCLRHLTASSRGDSILARVARSRSAFPYSVIEVVGLDGFGFGSIRDDERGVSAFAHRDPPAPHRLVGTTVEPASDVPCRTSVLTLEPFLLRSRFVVTCVPTPLPPRQNSASSGSG